MARLINAAESWTTVYTAFSQINFSAFDYNTVKQSLLAYVQLYFPEDFNDYIESSEFVAILELFSYMAELTAYRADMNAHENFMATAQRKESVLRLANFISYTPSRNLPARGLVKITSITTTQSIFDSLGTNLANIKIVWNDSSNPNWSEQFFLIINNVLTQPFGTVLPSDRVQVGDVLLELYTLNNTPLTQTGTTPVLTYTTAVQGTTLPMELVPITLTSSGPTEKRPENNTQFTLMYGNDGLGDGSPTTGFLMYTKQGALSSVTTSFDGVTPNQTYNIPIDNINDTDIWVNNIDPNTGNTLTVNPLPSSVTSIMPGYSTIYGYWYQVNTAAAQNIIFSTNNNRHKYEVETDNNDQVTLVFGDGEMADIPQGTFQVWYRVSDNSSVPIPSSAVSNKTSSFTYVDDTGTTQTLSFTFSLTSSLLNGSASETQQHIQSTAPSVYATQDRMVNGQDYNTYMLQDPSILKLVAVNRTFAGDSKYIAWHDPTGTYENIKIFGNDLALYFQNIVPPYGKLSIVTTPVSAEELILNYLQPLLISTDFFTTLAPIYSANGLNPAALRTAFTASEITAFTNVINGITSPQTFYLYFSVSENTWTMTTINALPDATYIFMAQIDKVFVGSNQTGWTINYASTTLIAQSPTTNFWNTNNGTATINYNTLNSNQDNIVILAANIDAQQGILGNDLTLNVISQVINPLTPGLPNLSQLSVLPTDINNDGIPEDMNLQELLNYTVAYQLNSSMVSSGNANQYIIQLPRTYPVGYGATDLIVTVTPNGSTISYPVSYTSSSGATYYFTDYLPPSNPNAVLTSQIQIGGIIPIGSASHTIGIGDTVNVTMVDYCYLQRSSVSNAFSPVLTSDTIKTLWAADVNTTIQQQTTIRYPGRYPFNFAWFHQAADYHLIDPAASNIIDMYIITVGYYELLQQWLNGQTSVRPTPPSSLDLKTSYATLLQAGMLTDTVVLHSGDFTLLFGPNADPTLQATFAVVRPPTNVTMTNNQVQNEIVSIIQDFFDPTDWQMGETFEFQELSAVVMQQLASEISSFVIVPTYSANQFGDLFEIPASENRLFMPDISANQINIVTSLTPQVLRQAGY
jgi:hypothetical protein